MAYFVFVVDGHLREGQSVVTVGGEDGVVAEAFVAVAFGGDGSAADALEEGLGAVGVYEGNDGAELRGAVGIAVEGFE